VPENLYEWSWWFFSAIVLTIVLNIFSDYVKPRIDLIWQKYSDKRKRKNIEEENKINSVVDNMLQDPRETHHVYSMLNYWATRSYAYFILVFIMVTMNLVVTVGLNVQGIKFIQTSTFDLAAYNKNTGELLLLLAYIGMTVYGYTRYRQASDKLSMYNKIYSAYRKKRELTHY
jgi:hypothetical protein